MLYHLSYVIEKDDESNTLHKAFANYINSTYDSQFMCDTQWLIDYKHRNLHKNILKFICTMIKDINEKNSTNFEVTQFKIWIDPVTSVHTQFGFDDAENWFQRHSIVGKITASIRESLGRKSKDHT
ncbi:hypothetical protein [Bilophila wadsworthia]|jgi:hypothetical protein|uniref:hypothetical protein n=1 Tax=Bilophila wadsworthia TaxID=35833 RepID=UPI0032C02287